MGLNFNRKSEKYLKAYDKVPEELRAIFEQMVDEYAYQALQLYGRNWAAYDVIAELVKAGWRPSPSKEGEK